MNIRLKFLKYYLFNNLIEKNNKKRKKNKN